MSVTQPLSWITLPDVKEHLNISAENETHDVELGKFIARAEVAIYNRVGHVKRLVEPVVEYREGNRRRVWLDDVPVSLVDEITVPGPVPVAEADRDVADPDGWYLENEHEQRAGIIRHTTRFPVGWVKITHRPGREPVPADLEMAALEMVRHLWDASQRGGSGQSHPGLRNRSSGDDGEHDEQDEADSLPPRVLEMVRPYLLPERPR